MRSSSENWWFKNLWEPATRKTTKFHFSGISENWGGYLKIIRNFKKNQAGSLAPLKEPELTDLTKKWEPPNTGTDPSNPNNGMIPTLHNQKVDTGYNK
jgi:hypothetical protein